MNYVQFEFQTNNNVENEILLALLADAGFEGFEECSNHLNAFIKESLFSQEIVEEILQLVPVKYSKKLIESTNWNAIWESSFEPVTVSNFAGIRASFHAPIKDVLHEIIITPKMSFGTGHHATTWLMMEQMSCLEFAGKRVLDFGTGTGVLAILAEKMGATQILAIDNDDWSIDNARENILANACNKIEVEKASAISGDGTWDIILANINLNVILGALPEMVKALKTGGKLLLSGFLEADIPAIKYKLDLLGFEPLRVTTRNGWVCVQALQK